ncbi:hypothetical protein LTR85_009220 [Meristemomyces frigidus]|nr:hypothetical protein LTR85_009220 [Meristemomyces frigidus]
MAYGRTGKRRHELMLPLLSKAGREQLQESMGTIGVREDVSSLANDAVAGTHPHKNPTAKDVNRGQWAPYAPGLTPQLRTLLQSQIRKPPPHLTRPTLRRLQPRVEELNAWRQPMPLCRVKNQTKKWYADLLGKVHPPLPKDEWKRLRDLAAGVATEPMVRRRRALSTSKSHALELLVHFGKPDIQAAFGNRDAHQITPRFMRRMWAQVFSQCPLMDWDAERREWKVTWGQHALHGLGRGRELSDDRTYSNADDALLGGLLLSQQTTDETEQMDYMDDMDFF